MKILLDVESTKLRSRTQILRSLPLSPATTRSRTTYPAIRAKESFASVHDPYPRVLPRTLARPRQERRIATRDTKVPRPYAQRACTNNQYLPASRRGHSSHIVPPAINLIMPLWGGCVLPVLAVHLRQSPQAIWITAKVACAPQ